MACTSSLKDITDYFTAFSQIVIAATIAWIAFRQWATNKEKLRLDLYNRRFDVYAKTMDFFVALSEYDPVNGSEKYKEIQRDFIKSYRESQFLFNEESGIFEILLGIHNMSFKVTGFKEEGKTINDSGAHEEFLKMYSDSNDSLMKFAIDIERLEKAISPYLNFHQISK